MVKTLPTFNDGAMISDCSISLQDMLARLKTARKAGSVASVLHIAALTQEVCFLKLETFLQI